MKRLGLGMGRGLSLVSKDHISYGSYLGDLDLDQKTEGDNSGEEE